MKTAALMMASLMAPAMGALDITRAGVATCKTNADCNTFDTATANPPGTCTAATAKCANCVSDLGTGVANLKATVGMCHGAASATSTLTLYYALTNGNIAGNAARNINCANLNTANYNTRIKAAASAFSATERASMEIVHLCNSATAGHTLHTSIKVTVNVNNFVSNNAYITLPTDINTELTNNVATDATLNALGEVKSTLAFRDAALTSYCTQTNGVYVPFAATPNTLTSTGATSAGNECKAVSCTNGYTFSTSVASPSCSGPGSVTTANIVTCTSDTDCAKYGRTGTCSTTATNTYTCTDGTGTTGNTCTNFVVGTNTLKQCNEVATPATTDMITVYYLLRHHTMTGHATRAVNCANLGTFSSVYTSLITSQMATDFTTAERNSVSVVHYCETVNTVQTLMTSIKLEVAVDRLLSTTATQYRNLALTINYALETSTNAVLNDVGGVDTVTVGTKEAYLGLCPPSTDANQVMQAPMSSTPHSTTAANRGCKVVECSSGYTITNGACTATPVPGPDGSGNGGLGLLPVTATFGVNGELNVIGAAATVATGGITSTVAGVLGSATVCHSICVRGTSTCWTCAQAATVATTANRAGSALAAADYTMAYTGTSSSSLTSLQTALQASLASYFAATTGLSLIANSVGVVYTVTDDDDGLSGGAIAGIVIGCVVFVIIVVVLVYCLCCKKAPESDAASSSSSSDKKKTSPDEV